MLSHLPQGPSLSGRPEAFAPAGRNVEIGLRLLGFGPLIVLVLLAGAVAAFAPHFVSGRNISNIFAQTAVISVVALGQHLVILTRGIDLSVGSNLALSSVAGALVFKATGSAAATVAAMVGTGAIVGLLNGGFFVYGRLPHPFIITLATLSIARGLALELADGRAVQGMPPAVRWLGTDGVFGLPGSILVVTGTAALMFVLTQTMVWGRWIYAVGGREDAALRMGIPVRAVLISCYVISGFCAGVGAIISRAGLTRVRPSTAAFWSLTPSPQSSSAAQAFLAGAARSAMR